MWPKYLIYCNTTFGSIPSLTDLPLKTYRLRSFISFEQIVDDINHFVCVGMSPHGYFIYDDLLILTPGGWQGGFAPKDSPVYAENFAELCEKVPIFILELCEGTQGNTFWMKEEEKEVKKEGKTHSMRLRYEQR